MNYIKVIQKNFYVHRLVATAFIANPQNKTEVNHIDGNKLNNHIENLEWNTKSENIRHSFKTGLHVSPMQGRKGSKSPFSKPVIQYDLSGNFVKLWLSISEAANYYSIKPTNISSCARKRHKTSINYIWRYLESDYIPFKIEL